MYFYLAPGVIIGLAPYLEEGRVELAFPLFSLPPSEKNIHHLQRSLKILIAPSCLIFIFVELSSLSSDFFLDQQSNGCLGVFWNGSEVNDCSHTFFGDGRVEQSLC